MVHDGAGRLPLRLNEQLVVAERVAGLRSEEELHELLERYVRYTARRGGRPARPPGRTEAGWFWWVVPRDDAAAVLSAAEGVRSRCRYSARTSADGRLMVRR